MRNYQLSMTLLLISSLPIDVLYGTTLGLTGLFFALIAYAFVIFGCLKVASKASDRFGSMIAVAVSVLLMTHLFVNIGMTIGITPITGLPLPFLSYGGSFLVTCFLMLGVVQSVFRHRKVFRS